MSIVSLEPNISDSIGSFMQEHKKNPINGYQIGYHSMGYESIHLDCISYRRFRVPEGRLELPCPCERCQKQTNFTVQSHFFDDWLPMRLPIFSSIIISFYIKIWMDIVNNLYLRSCFSANSTHNRSGLRAVCMMEWSAECSIVAG